MDPILVAAARALLKQSDSADAEKFMRQATGGKYGADDAEGYLKTINTDITPKNVARSYLQGVTSNFGDELMDQDPSQIGTGPVARATDSLFPGASLAAGAALKWLGAGKGAGEDVRARDEAFAAAHPWINGGARMAGTVTATAAIPELGIASKAGPLVRGALALAKGAGTGYALGAANAAGNVEPGEDRSAALTSPEALISAGIGAAAPAVVGAYRYIANPVRQAANRMGTAIAQSGGVRALLDKLEQFKQAGLGDQVTLGDLSHPLWASREFATNASEDAANSTIPLVAGRQAGQIPRLMDKAKQLLPEFGSETPSGSGRLDYLKSTRNAWAEGPDGYGGIRGDLPVGGAVPNTNFAQPALPMSEEGQAFVKTMKQLGVSDENMPGVARRMVTAQDRDAGNAFGGSTGMIQRHAQGFLNDLEAGAPSAARGANPAVLDEPIVTGAVKRAQDNGLSQEVQEAASAPTFDKLLAIKNRLQGKANAAFKAGDGDSGRAYASAGRRIDQHLAENVPDYMAVTQEYAGRMSLERSVQKGMDAWNSGDVSQLLRTAQKMSPEELLEFRRGLASSMFEKLNNTSTNRDVAAQLLDSSQEGTVGSSSGATQAKLKLIFGDKDSYDAFMQHAALEHEMSQARGTYSGSPTARRLQAATVEPVNLGLSSASQSFASGPNLAKSSAIRMIARMAKGQASEAAGGELGSALNTRGAKNIEELLRAHGNPSPLVGRGSTLTAPAAFANGVSNIFQQAQQP